MLKITFRGHFSYKYFVRFSCSNYEYDRKGIHGQYQSVISNYPVVLFCKRPCKGFSNWPVTSGPGGPRFFKFSRSRPILVCESLIGDQIWAGRFLVLFNSVTTDVMSIEFKNENFGILSTSVISEKWTSEFSKRVLGQFRLTSKFMVNI